MRAERVTATHGDALALPSPRKRDPVAREPIRFGGWTDYREWAEHDFRERSPAEEPGPATQGAVVVEVLTDLVPIKVLVEEENHGTRKSCLMPSSGIAVVDLAPEPMLESAESALIRPYVRAGVQPDAKHDLEFETVVEGARPYGTLPIKELTDDQRHVCRVCVVPQSVAEVAVAISAPLGLALTIISDCIAKGFLRVHNTVSIVDGMPSIDLLRRVYAGLSRLSDNR